MQVELRPASRSSGGIYRSLVSVTHVISYLGVRALQCRDSPGPAVMSYAGRAAFRFLRSKPIFSPVLFDLYENPFHSPLQTTLAGRLHLASYEFSSFRKRRLQCVRRACRLTLVTIAGALGRCPPATRLSSQDGAANSPASAGPPLQAELISISLPKQAT